MNRQPAKIEDGVFPIWQAATLAEELAYDIRNPELRITFDTGIPCVDDVFNPQLQGTLMTSLGRPSNGKTFWSNYLLLRTMEKMKAENRPPNEICVLVTTETSVEVTTLYWLSRLSGVPVKKVLRGEATEIDLKNISASVYQLMGLPFFIIGNSTQRSKTGRREMPKLGPSTITNAVDYILNGFKKKKADSQYEIKFMVTDYLQNLHKPDRKDNRTFYSETVGWAKDMATFIGGLHLLNVQANRDVDKRDIKIPQLGDGMETAAIEHKSQVVWSMHMPKMYNIELMPAIKKAGIDIPEIPVKKNLGYLSLLKQQEGESNYVWPVAMDFNNVSLKKIDPNRLRVSENDLYI